jgi:hypothetical protein
MNSQNFKRFLSGCVIASTVAACGKKAGPVVNAIPQRVNGTDVKPDSSGAASDTASNASTPSGGGSEKRMGMGELRVAEGRQALIDRLAYKQSALERAKENLTKAEAELDQAIQSGSDAAFNIGSGLIELTVGSGMGYLGARGKYMDMGFLAVNHPHETLGQIRQEILVANPDLKAPKFTDILAQADKDLSTQPITTKVIVDETKLEFRGVSKDQFFNDVRNAYKDASRIATGETFDYAERQRLTKLRWADYVSDVAKSRFKIISEARAASLEAQTALKLSKLWRKSNFRSGVNTTLIIGGLGASLVGALSLASGTVGVIVDRNDTANALANVSKIKAEIAQVQTELAEDFKSAIHQGIEVEVSNDSK